MTDPRDTVSVATRRRRPASRLIASDADARATRADIDVETDDRAAA